MTKEFLAAGFYLKGDGWIICAYKVAGDKYITLKISKINGIKERECSLK